MTDSIRISMMSLIAIILPMSTLGDTDQKFALILPFDLGQVSIIDLPAAAKSIGTVRFHTNSIAGFANSILSLPAKDNIKSFGFDGLFLEYGGNNMDGMRFYTDQLGLINQPANRTAVVVKGLIAGSRAESSAHAVLGSIPGGGTFAAAEQASLEITDQHSPTGPFGNQADRRDPFHLRGQVLGIRLANLLLSQYFPELSTHSLATGELSSDFRFATTINDQITRLTSILHFHLEEPSELKIVSHFEMHTDNPLTHQLNAVIAVDGLDLENDNAADHIMEPSRQLALLISQRLDRIKLKSPLIKAVASATYQFAKQGLAAEVPIQMTIPIEIPRQQSDTNKMVTLATHLGLLPNKKVNNN